MTALIHRVHSHLRAGHSLLLLFLIAHGITVRLFVTYACLTVTLSSSRSTILEEADLRVPSKDLLRAAALRQGRRLVGRLISAQIEG